MFRVECAVNGFPNLPSVTWYRGENQIVSSNGTFDISSRNYLQVLCKCFKDRCFSIPLESAFLFRFLPSKKLMVIDELFDRV